MRKLGFNDRWINLIMCYVKYVSYVVLVNGKTFTTSVFKLRRKLCNDIEAMLSKLWWCSKQDEKGVHWKRWDRMGDSKHKAGMRF